MTFFQVGDRVSVWGSEGQVIGVEMSEQPFRRNGMTDQLTKPTSPIEWVKVRFDDGSEHEYAVWDVRLVERKPDHP